MKLWGPEAHAELATLFRPDYAGYRPDVAEAPNGDDKPCDACAGTGDGQCAYDLCETCRGVGRVPNVDAGRAGKRYLHVAAKYDPHAWAMAYHDLAFAEACRVATALKVPAAFMPDVRYGALRVLEYPSAAHQCLEDDPKCSHCGAECLYPETRWPDPVCPALAAGAGTAEHRDFDLFTLNLWRSTPEDHEQQMPGMLATETRGWTTGTPAHHIGELGTIISLGPAPLHRVPARPYTQRALVYFAIPDHAARLPRLADGATDPSIRIGGETVGQWLAERVARSRVYK